MSKSRLVGSAASCNDLRDLLKHKWGWHDVTFDLITKQVSVNSKVIEGLRVTKRGNRVRLEMIEEVPNE